MNYATKKPNNYYRKGYLVLTRKVGEGFHIDNDTEVVISKITNGCVSVAIKAPGKSVVRTEIMKNQPRTQGDQDEHHSSIRKGKQT